MTTPVFDFIQKYNKSVPKRLHMPGHKGKNFLGAEKYDITEIDGADVLYHENGILKESQENASYLFDSKKTLYSTEGSTLCIRAMLALAKMYAVENGKDVKILAARNVHKSFVTSCALLDINPSFLQTKSKTLLSEKITIKDLELYLNENEAPTALYITSPDYLGMISDIENLADICHKNNILLLVDNAHGAYLHFFSESYHPISLGADLVCDSAHKTLPVLTGGAYLHISKNAPVFLSEKAAFALSLFASTSPSYLILQSLDLCNRYLSEAFREKLYSFSAKVHDLKKNLKSQDFSLIGDEPLKITIQAKASGYTGYELADLIKNKNLIPEFSDPDFLVLMLSPENGDETLQAIKEIFSKIPQKEPILLFPPQIPEICKKLSPKEAVFSPFEEISVENAVGRILSQVSVTCPPAIPIAISGEVITKDHLNAFSYYQIDRISVLKNK